MLTYTEVENKYQPNCTQQIFLKRCRALKPIKYLHTTFGIDKYYRSANGVVLRWRKSEDKSEFTIKYRKNEKNTTVRLEVDLDISNNSSKTIKNFIKLCGFKFVFRIIKNCHIFWFHTSRGIVSVTYYNVIDANRASKSYIEIEAEKNQNLSVDEAKKLILYWEKKLNLQNAKKVNRSVYEIYSNDVTPLLSDTEHKKVRRIGKEMKTFHKCHSTKKSTRRSCIPSIRKNSSKKSSDCHKLQ